MVVTLSRSTILMITASIVILYGFIFCFSFAPCRQQVILVRAFGKHAHWLIDQVSFPFPAILYFDATSFWLLHKLVCHEVGLSVCCRKSTVSKSIGIPVVTAPR